MYMCVMSSLHVIISSMYVCFCSMLCVPCLRLSSCLSTGRLRRPARRLWRTARLAERAADWRLWHRQRALGPAAPRTRSVGRPTAARRRLNWPRHNISHIRHTHITFCTHCHVISVAHVTHAHHSCVAFVLTHT